MMRFVCFSVGWGEFGIVVFSRGKGEVGIDIEVELS